jgi:hypothetical protein
VEADAPSYISVDNVMKKSVIYFSLKNNQVPLSKNFFMTVIISNHGKLASLLLSITFTVLDKHTSLLYYGINYSCKMFYDTAP